MHKFQSEAFVVRWLDAVKHGNLEAFDDLVSERVLDPSTGEHSPRAAFRARASAIEQAFSELDGRVDELLVDGDRIAWRWTLTGAQRAPFLGEPATGKRIRLNGTNFQRLASGVVIEHYTLFDAIGALRQMRDVRT